MQVELIKRGSQAELEVPIKVLYKSALVGEYYADLLVDGSVMVEIKVAKVLQPRRRNSIAKRTESNGRESRNACQFRTRTR